MRTQQERQLDAINAVRPYHVTSIGGMCPTQAEGTLPDGRFFYFRARHGQWTLRVAEDPEAVYWDALPLASGDDATNGFMDFGPVLAILDQHLPIEARP